MSRSCWMDLDTTLGGGAGNYGVRCDATVCNPVIYAPGPFGTFPGVGWLKHLNISLQCAANGIDWQAGNTLRISDSVIQGYAQYGVRAGVRRGGYGGFELANVLRRSGSVRQSTGRYWASRSDRARQPASRSRAARRPTGTFPSVREYRNYRLPLLHCRAARHARVLRTRCTQEAPSPMEQDSITVTTPDIAGATHLRLAASNSDWRAHVEQAPYGTGNYAVRDERLPEPRPAPTASAPSPTPRPRSQILQRGPPHLLSRCWTSGRAIWS